MSHRPKVTRLVRPCGLGLAFLRRLNLPPTLSVRDVHLVIEGADTFLDLRCNVTSALAQQIAAALEDAAVDVETRKR